MWGQPFPLVKPNFLKRLSQQPLFSFPEKLGLAAFMELVRRVPKDLQMTLHNTDSAMKTAITRDWMIWLIQQLFTGHCSFETILSVENLPHLNDESENQSSKGCTALRLGNHRQHVVSTCFKHNEICLFFPSNNS